MYYLRFVALLLVALALASCGGPHQWSGTLVEPPKPLTDFTLPDQNGEPFQLGAAQPNLALLYFGYTNCPDFCPTTLGEWKQIKQELGANADKVRFVLVSVDPERDTEQALKAYVERFDPAFIGVRPTPEQVGALSREYGFGVEVAQAGSDDHRHDLARHGTYTYLLDQSGGLRLLFRYGTPPKEIARDIAAVLAQQ